MQTFSAVVLFAATVLAQQLSDLPECGQTCIQNMLDLAPSLGCEAQDVACLCSSMNFGYGVRDCSAQACPPDTELSNIEAYAVEYCGTVEPTAAQGAVTETPAVTDPSAVTGSDSDSTETETVTDTEEPTETVNEGDAEATEVVITMTSDGMIMTTTVAGAANGTDGGAIDTATETVAETTVAETTVGDGSEETGGAGESASSALSSADPEATDAAGEATSEDEGDGEASETTGEADAAYPAATVAAGGVAGMAGLAALLVL